MGTRYEILSGSKECLFFCGIYLHIHIAGQIYRQRYVLHVYIGIGRMYMDGNVQIEKMLQNNLKLMCVRLL